MASQRPTFDPERMAVPQDVSLTPRTVTVSQLNAMIKGLLINNLPGTIHLVGEISNFSRPSSGHLYLTLKDDRSEVRAVMWRSAASATKFKVADGMEVIATGHIDVYEARGQYQFYIRKLEPRGIGALELAFRQLRDKLAGEGLFDPARKRAIPRYPRCVAVVTSPTGAAIRDILNTLRRRFRCVSILFHPTSVQGEGAAAEIAEVITRLNAQAEALGGIDVMIVGRGGGSLEDLWSFNEEVVARAIAASKIPIISGIGHEIDITIADLVADLRAPTPTAAAELAVPVLDDLIEDLSAYALRFRQGTRRYLEQARSRLETITRIEWFRDPMTMIHRMEQRLDELVARLQLNCSQMLTHMRRRLHQSEIVLATVRGGQFVFRRQGLLVELLHRLRWVMQQRIRANERRIDGEQNALLFHSPDKCIQVNREKIGQSSLRLETAITHYLHLSSQFVETLSARLESTNFRQTLARGYTITRVKSGLQIITSADQVKSGDLVRTETADGEFESCVGEKRGHSRMA